MLPTWSLLGLEIQTYYLYLSLWTSFLVWLTFHLAYKQGLNVRVALNTAATILISGFFGARLMHVIFEHLEYYVQNPQRIFYFWEGGFVFMGGLLASFTVVWLYHFWRKHNFLQWADFFAPIIALGYGGGRFACFLAGCCYGKTCLYPWRVTFADGIPRHPTQLYAMAIELGIALLLFKAQQFKFRIGTIFSFWLIGHGFARLLMENFRADFRGVLIKGLTVSTWLSFLIIVTGASLLLYLQLKSYLGKAKI